MAQHPEPHIRRAVRVLGLVAELHKRGYQQLRVMPYMAPSGTYWRCSISHAKHFYRNHGAILYEATDGIIGNNKSQADAMVARYSSGQNNDYFGWRDAEKDDARSLADKFIHRFRQLADLSKGWDYFYAGWYLRLLGLAEAGWMPVVLSDYSPVSYDRIPVIDVRLEKKAVQNDDPPILPLPPAGELDKDYVQ